MIPCEAGKRGRKRGREEESERERERERKEKRNGRLVNLHTNYIGLYK